jgi:hypothetical protein
MDTEVGGGVTHSGELLDPTSSSDMTSGGVRISRSDSADFFFTANDFQLDVRLIGLLEGETSATAETHPYDSPATTWGRWTSPPSHYPHDLRRDDSPQTLSSGGPPESRGRLSVDKIMQRPHLWRFLEAAHVYDRRATGSTEASVAGLAQDDTSNGFIDVYERMGKGNGILVQYGTAGGLDPLNSGDYEWVNNIPTQPLSAIKSDVENRERYDLSFTTDIRERDITTPAVARHLL